MLPWKGGGGQSLASGVAREGGAGPGTHGFSYAPDLNPVEPLWGNVKTQEMANVCAPDLVALRRPLRAGVTRIRCRPTLAFAFLRHAGLAF